MGYLSEEQLNLILYVKMGLLDVNTASIVAHAYDVWDFEFACALNNCLYAR